MVYIDVYIRVEDLPRSNDWTRHWQVQVVSIGWNFIWVCSQLFGRFPFCLKRYEGPVWRGDLRLLARYLGGSMMTYMPRKIWIEVLADRMKRESNHKWYLFRLTTSRECLISLGHTTSIAVWGKMALFATRRQSWVRPWVKDGQNLQLQ